MKNKKIICDAPSNAIFIDSSNPSIERNDDKCINCGICTQTCVIREGINYRENSDLCVYCGQCVQTCPTKAIIPRMEYSLFEKAKKNGKICIAYTSPAVRVAIGDAFGLGSGEFLEGKLVGLLKMLGFDYVFDTTIGADLTIMEEVSELLGRIKNNDRLPMFTSCCPAWVKYAEQFHPKLIDNISSCKSPIGMMGEIVNKYIENSNDLDSDNVYTVAITPCTAKKYEIKRGDIRGTNLVLTINEIIDIIRDKDISFNDIPEIKFDSIFSGSGSGLIFGNSGGVMEASIKSLYYMVNGRNIDDGLIKFKKLDYCDGIREATIEVSDEIKLNVCVINGINNAKDILNDIEKGKSKYHFIEIMNCRGGCIGGGGQSKNEIYHEDDVLTSRSISLNSRDKDMEIRFCHSNPNINIIYDKYLCDGDKYKILHTSYKDLSYLNEEEDIIREKSCGALIYRYIDDKLEILLLKHKAGHYSFSKGHVEDGETEVETALREIKEEVNLDVCINTDFREINTYSPKKGVIKDVVYFAAIPRSDDIIIQESEIIDASWYGVDLALSLLTYDNDKYLLNKLIEYLR